MSARFELRGEPAPELEFPTAAEVRVLRVQPGDTLVFITESPISDAAAAKIRAEFKEHHPDLKAMILYGCDLAVIRREGAGDGDG